MSASGTSRPPADRRFRIVATVGGPRTLLDPVIHLQISRCVGPNPSDMAVCTSGIEFTSAVLSMQVPLHENYIGQLDLNAWSDDRIRQAFAEGSAQRDAIES
jgi:hypothetical protein